MSRQVEVLDHPNVRTGAHAEVVEEHDLEGRDGEGRLMTIIVDRADHRMGLARVKLWASQVRAIDV